MNATDYIKSKANKKGKRLKGNWLSLIYHAVKALGEIAEQLGKKDWNTSVDPCINDTSWLTPKLDSRPLYKYTTILSFAIAPTLIVYATSLHCK